MRELRTDLMLKLACRAVAASLLALVLPTVAARAHITPVEQERFCSADGTRESAPDFGYFEAGSLWSTNQASNILLHELYGDLNGRPGGDTSGLSFYRVELDVDQTTMYALTAELMGLDSFYFGLGWASLTLSIFDTRLGEYEALLHYFASDGFVETVSETGTLEPGRYQLEVFARGSSMEHSYFGTITGSGHATFSLAIPVPDPDQSPAFSWASVGDPGNAPDIHGAGYGSVGTVYRIAKHEVTNAQYAEFLNAVAAADTYALYSTLMDTSSHGGISRSGSSGSYAYSTKARMADKPVSYVSFYDALRFANWMHNGQPTGTQSSDTTEDGAYDLSLGSSVARKEGAVIFLPSEDEWYKAAYYDTDSSIYFDYPAGDETQTSCAAPWAFANAANCDDAVGTVTDAGSYTRSASPAGTFDQGGNVREWSEALFGSNRVLRGGSFTDPSSDFAASERGVSYPTNQYSDVGFRVASIHVAVPEPSTATLGAVALALLAALRRRAGHTRAA
jgi:hypothetical protein